MASLACLALSIIIIAGCVCCERMMKKRRTGRITKVYQVYYSATGEQLSTKQEVRPHFTFPRNFPKVKDRNPEYEATPLAEKEKVRRKKSEKNCDDEMYEPEKNYKNMKS